MGIIRVNISGSFRPNQHKTFSSEENGHAAAVANLIKWLADDVLPKAIRLDHEEEEEDFGDVIEHKDSKYQHVYIDQKRGSTDGDGTSENPFDSIESFLGSKVANLEESIKIIHYTCGSGD